MKISEEINLPNKLEIFCANCIYRIKKFSTYLQQTNVIQNNNNYSEKKYRDIRDVVASTWPIKISPLILIIQERSFGKKYETI